MELEILHSSGFLGDISGVINDVGTPPGILI